MESEENVIKYKKNFLTNVIFRIDFPSISEFNSTKLKEFQKLIREEFPIIQEQKTDTFNIPLGDKNIEAKGFERLVWIFINKDNTKKAALGKDYLSLELTKYDSFEELYPKIELLVESLFKIFPEIVSSRVGLRYINEIYLDEENPYDLSKYIHENLIKSIGFFEEDKSPLSKYISVIETKKEEFNLVFKFGIPNSLYPNKIIKKEFVLDYDCSTTEGLEGDEITEKVEGFNKEITLIFEKSIKEDLRNKMGRV